MSAGKNEAVEARKRSHSATQVEHENGVLVLVHDFDAPRELLFDAWTKPEHFARWFGPKGATMPYCTVDLRVGGTLHFFLRVPGDVDVWCKGIFHEIEQPTRLVFTWHFSNEAGERVERPGFPIETTVAVTFAGHAQGTRITVRQEGLLIDQGEIQGWREGFDRLDVLLRKISNGAARRQHDGEDS